MKVFVSYSRRDTEFVDRLDRDLTAFGHQVWVDRSDIVGGGEDRWRRSIVNAIRDSEAMLLVLSPNSIASDNVERELSVAADNKKRVVPLLYQQCELPSGFEYELAGVQYIDFTAMKYDEAVAQLSAQLGPVGVGMSDEPSPTPPIAASGDRDKRARAFAWAGGGAAALVAVGVLLWVMTRGDDPGQALDPPRTTQARATSVVETTTASTPVTTTPTRVPPSTSHDSPATTESAAPSTSDNSPATTAETSSAVTDTTATTAPVQADRDRARAVVLEWFAATSARDWDRVREIDPAGLGKPYDEYYGGPDATAHMESIQPYILGADELEPGKWLITGAVAAYDTQAVSDTYPTGYRTNFVCSRWVVDLNADPAPTSDWTGVKNHEFKQEGKLPSSEFAAAYADWCVA